MACQTATASRDVDGRPRLYQRRRPELLFGAAEYVLNRGIGALSLRAMASVLGVTHATLLRHFTSKDDLLQEITEELRRRAVHRIAADRELKLARSTRHLLLLLWRRLDDPQERRQLILEAEMYGSCLRDRGRYTRLLKAVQQEWLATIRAKLVHDGVAPDSAAVIATTLLAQVRGLQIDLVVTGEFERINHAFEAMLDVVLGREDPLSQEQSSHAASEAAID